jgi:DNA-binding IclR family transcriptional regulator
MFAGVNKSTLPQLEGGWSRTILNNKTRRNSQLVGEKRKTVPAIYRALRVLEMLASTKRGLTLSEIARNLEVGRSSAFYILNELELNGYVSRPSPRGRYSFTAKLFSLANSSLIGMGVRQEARPLLQSLHRRTGLTVHLGVLADDEVVIIDKITSASMRPLATWIGKRLPIHCTGIGKALMAHQPSTVVSRFLAHGLIRYNENTIVAPVRFERELERIRSQGFAYDDEEETIGLRCVGAPLLTAEGEASAAFSVAGTIAQFDEEHLPDLIKAVQETAELFAKEARTARNSLLAAKFKLPM